MTEPIKLPPLPDIPAAICPWDHSEGVVKNLLEAYATAAIEADRKTSSKQLATYKRWTESLEKRLTLVQARHDELKKSNNPELLASERAANAILTAELEADRQQREKDLQLCEEALEVEIQHSRRLQKELDGLRADRQRSAAELASIYEMFHIGTAAREPHILRQNIENVKRRADCLGAVEHEFFMVPGEPDEDYPDDEPADECLLRWGAEPESYVEQFRTALDRIRPAEISDRQRRGEPVHVNWVRDGIANFIADNWPDRKHSLNEIERGIRQIEIRPPQPQQTPEGYKLVPIEPTEEMLKAAQTAWLNDPARRTTTIYRAMLEATPPPVEAGDQTGQKMPAIRMSTGIGGGAQDGGAA